MDLQNVNFGKDGLERNGYEKIALLNKKQSQAIAEVMKGAVQDKAFSDYVWRDAHGGDHRIFGLENAFSDIADIKYRLDDVLRVLYGQEIESTILAQHVVASPGNQGSGGMFHRDSQTRQFKAFVYLTDATAKSGALQIVKKSHKTSSKIIECFRQRRIRFDITEPVISEKDKLEIIPAKAGEVLLCNTSCVHRGLPGLQEDRVNLTLYAFRKGKMPPHIRSRIYT